MILIKLFLEFFKIGLFTFGGGYAMIPLIREMVIRHSWLSEDSFYNFLGICESTPGPIAVNMATYVGSTQAGFLGSVIATMGVVLPSFIIIILIATFLQKITKNNCFKNFMSGVKTVVVGLIISTGIILFINCCNVSTNIDSFNYHTLIILPIITFIYFIFKLVSKKKLNTLPLIFISSLVGLFVNVLL